MLFWNIIEQFLISLSSLPCEGACFDDCSLSPKAFLPDSCSVSRRLRSRWLVLGWRGESWHFWNAKLQLYHLHSSTGGMEEIFSWCFSKKLVLMFNLTLFFLQFQIVSEPLKLNGALDSLVLGGVQVFGVDSPPLYVLANGEKVHDFVYQANTKVRFCVSALNFPTM